MSAFATHQFAPVRAYDELARTPGYVAEFDPVEDKVEAVLYHYVFVTQCQCGISSCRHHHNEGFVVKLESGLISHVGHHCWKKKFQEIGDILNRFQEQQEFPRLVTELTMHKVACNTHRSFISNLRTELIPLVERKRNFRTLFPRVFAELEVKAGLGGQYRVIKEMEFVKESAKSKPESARKSDDYENSQELVGIVNGCEFIQTSALVLLSEAEKIIEKVEKCYLVDVSFSKLHATTLEASSIDSYVSKAKALLKAGTDLFSIESADAIRRMEGNQALSQEARNYDVASLDEPNINKNKVPKKLNRAQRRARYLMR